MTRLLFLVALGVIVYRMIVGRWPWDRKISPRGQAILRARRLLAVEAGSSRDDIVAAHRRLVARVHPDRGGSEAQVHEANAARDLLLDQLPGHHLDHQEPR